MSSSTTQSNRSVAGLHELPRPAPSEDPFDQLNRAAEQAVKRRADVVGIFPNEGAITRLIGAVLLEANDEWQHQHRYMQTEAMAELIPPTINAVSTTIATTAA